MKTKLFSVLLVFFSFLTSASGSSRFYDHLNYGVEWGYSMTFFNRYDYNYNNFIGTRISRQGSEITYKSNGHLVMFAGARICDHYTADLCTGVMGIYEGRTAVPVSLRGSYFLRGYSSDGFKFFAESGFIKLYSLNDKLGNFLKSGIGYRLMLDRKLALDLIVSWQLCNDHPYDLYDHENKVFVNPRFLLKSDSRYQSINYSLALSF